jgi:hypothetical protein
LLTSCLIPLPCTFCCLIALSYKHLISVAQFDLSRYSLIFHQSGSYYGSVVTGSAFENVKKRVSS